MPEMRIDGRTVRFEPGATIMQAAAAAGIEIPALCAMPDGRANTSCFVCVVKVAGMRKLTPSCATVCADGMAVENETVEVRDARRTAIELLLSDHLGDCVAPCQGVCPARMDIPRMMRLTAQGRYREALINVKETIALPAALGRICPDLCEKGCRRAARDGALSVCLTKRFVADHDLASGDPYLPECAPHSGKSVAIVGGGPAGLSAAAYLRRLGHACTIYDDHAELGGNLRYAIDPETLPPSVIDAEIGTILALGARAECGVAIGRDASLQELRSDHDALVIAAGDVKATGAVDLLGPLLAAGPQGFRVDKQTMMTPTDGVFAAGSAVVASRHAVRAVADGRDVAMCIDSYLRGEGMRRGEREFSVHIGRLEGDEVEPYLVTGARTGRHEPARGEAAGFTDDEVVREAERCLHCDCRKAHDCQLRSLAIRLGANPGRFRGERRAYEIDTSNPAVIFEAGKCIACGICVRIAAQAKERLGLTFIGRGFSVKTSVPFDGEMGELLRDTARACADACPTGALTAVD